MNVYDGKGGLTIKATYNDIPGSAMSFVTQKATYTINPDCTGRVFAGETHYLDLFASPDGSFVSAISIQEGVQMNEEAKRATKKILDLTPQ